MVAGIMGAVSAKYDDTFVRLILGDGYVNMTLENIKSGNPTNVYAGESEVMMFFSITWNNIMVSFRVFVFGIFASLGTGFYLFYNGLMVGTFIMFFSSEQQLESGTTCNHVARNDRTLLDCDCGCCRIYDGQ